MICAISRAAIIEAARHGKDSTSFHGYQITAKRIGAGSAADGLIEVTLCAERGSGRSARAVIEVARLPYLGSAWLIEALPASRGPPVPDYVSRWLCQPD